MGRASWHSAGGVPLRPGSGEAGVGLPKNTRNTENSRHEMPRQTPSSRPFGKPFRLTLFWLRVQLLLRLMACGGPPAPSLPFERRMPDTPISDSASIDARLQDALPHELRGPSTTITRIAVGMSGAAVYRVTARARQYVLKITAPDEPIAGWRDRLQVQRSAATAGIAPQLLHVDEAQRAMLSELIVDRSFAAQLGNPATRSAAILALGQMLGKRRALPMPAAMEPADPKAFLRDLWSTVTPDAVVPIFVRDAVAALQAESVPASAEALVMSHNDVNPSNLVFDGVRIMLLDWQAAAPNSPLYDLATVAMFFRMDDAACLELIAAHNDAPLGALPEQFRYYRRCAAILSGTAALLGPLSRGHVARDVTIDETPALAELYQQMRDGTFDLRSASGQWSFGLALVKEGVG